MAVDQFCLKWNNFQTSIVTAFGSLQSTEDLADVTLTCEGISIKAHKIILSACSPYFRAVFKENPCSHPVVILKDVLHSDLVAVLNFMYHGEVIIAQDKLVSFLQTAEALQVSGLVANPGLQHLPIKLTSSSNRSCSKSPKLCKTTEFIDNTQKRIKLTPKFKTVKANQSRVPEIPATVVARLPENPLGVIGKFPESPTAATLARTPENSTPSPKLILGTDSPPIEKFETIAVGSIKTEVVEDFHGDHNFNDKIDAYDSNDKGKLQSSILEAALEVKESQPSILERSLTSHASKSPSLISYALDNVTVIQQPSPDQQESLYITKKLDYLEHEKRGLKHRLSESSTQSSKTFDLTLESPEQKNFKLDEDYMKNIEANIQGLPSDISVVNVRSIQDVQPHHSSQCGNCPHCGKIYSNQSALKYHVRLVHSDLTNMYCCHLCPESFDYREGYKKHMVEAHSIRN